MKLTKLKIEDLTEYPGNYNKHPESQLSELKRSLEDFGQFKNIVVWQNKVIAGNGLVMAAKERGDSDIYAIDRSDLTQQQAESLLIADNETAKLALPDMGDLSELLKGFDEPLDIPGVSEDLLNSLNFGSDDEPGLNDKESPEDFPEYDEEIETEYCCPKCNYQWSGKPK